MRKWLAAGNELPPIIVWKTGDTYVVVDGRHRYFAHMEEGRTEIAARVFTDREEAVAVRDREDALRTGKRLVGTQWV